MILTSASHVAKLCSCAETSHRLSLDETNGPQVRRSHRLQCHHIYEAVERAGKRAMRLTVALTAVIREAQVWLG